MPMRCKGFFYRQAETLKGGKIYGKSRSKASDRRRN